MADSSMPTARQVSDALVALGGRATALQLCNSLTNAGFAIGRAQLAMQRATDFGGPIRINKDLTLSVKRRTA